MKSPFAITLGVGSSLSNRTGNWRMERPVFLDRQPPCNDVCPTGENIQRWLYHASADSFEEAWRQIVADNLAALKSAIIGLEKFLPKP